jgi:hypothetical protein
MPLAGWCLLAIDTLRRTWLRLLERISSFLLAAVGTFGLGPQVGGQFKEDSTRLKAYPKRGLTLFGKASKTDESDFASKGSAPFSDRLLGRIGAKSVKEKRKNTNRSQASFRRQADAY